ncbi:hypothetical protein [Streptomyces fructofermentans]|uniref:hypothetical protein n=1 Tax=Streptomyces fructofermentans TaxID=152141 RepID=UPI0037906BB1
MTAGAALLLAAVLPGRAVAADAPAPYGFAAGAERIEGAADAADAVPLAPGRTYRSSIGENAKIHYGLRLDGASTAYVSATAVPRAGAEVVYSDGIKVSLRDAQGNKCFSGDAGSARFGPTESPRTLTAWASRGTGPGTYTCKRAGTYSVLVERISGARSSPGDWDLELQYVSEPALRRAAPTGAPRSWDSATPEAVEGTARTRRGGTSFNEARSLERGVWKDGIGAGQTLYYRVPVDWGQRLHATAELGPADGDGYLGTALVMSLHNPARALVDDVDTPYDGSRRTAVLEPLPAVAYENRYAVDDQVGGMRFAGWYYLAVHLGAGTSGKFGDGPFELTLRVRVDGTAAAAPEYAGSAAPREVFDVTAGDRAEAADGAAATGDGGGAGGSTAMKALAAGGIGTGCALLLGLGVWTFAARRRAAAAPVASVPYAPGAATAGRQSGAPGQAVDGTDPGGHGPPRAW